MHASPARSVVKHSRADGYLSPSWTRSPRCHGGEQRKSWETQPRRLGETGMSVFRHSSCHWTSSMPRKTNVKPQNQKELPCSLQPLVLRPDCPGARLPLCLQGAPSPGGLPLFPVLSEITYSIKPPDRPPPRWAKPCCFRLSQSHASPGHTSACRRVGLGGHGLCRRK